MTRAEKVERAQELRAEGLTLREIGERLGVTHSCVAKWLNPDLAKLWTQRAEAKPGRYEAKLAWQRAYDTSPEGRGKCERCNEPMGYGSARAHARVCRPCLIRQSHATLRRLEQLWNEGKSYPEIQAEFGWSKGMVSRTLHRGRELGYNLPYRYELRTRDSYRFPEQVAA